MHFNLIQLITSFGYAGVLGIVFAESCLVFFLPGDSLLFVAGLLASRGILNIWLLLIGSFVCAVLGNNVGYAIGHKLGRRLFRRDDSWLFQKKHLVATEKFYAKRGKMAVVLARFLPVVRTFAPIVAGIGSMQYRTFMVYNLIGGFLWTFGITLAGFFLGQFIPADKIDKYILPIVLVIVVISIAPSIIHLYQERKSSKH